MGPREAQERPKREPKRPKRGQKGAQESPKSSPRELQKAAKSISSDVTKTSKKTQQNAAFYSVLEATRMPRAAQKQPKRRQDDSMRVQDRLQMA